MLEENIADVPVRYQNATNRDEHTHLSKQIAVLFCKENQYFALSSYNSFPKTFAIIAQLSCLPVQDFLSIKV